jgi:V/A-type H+-transporting ATPase subunit C
MSGSYEYATGSVRAREGKLLREQDIELLCSAKSTEKLLAGLRDKGLAEPSDTDVDALLSRRMTELWEYISSVAPDMALFDCFVLRGDAHNAKLIVKGILRARDWQPLLVSRCSINPDEIKAAVTERKYDRLPEWLSGAVERACEAVNAGDAQLADAFIDRAVMEQMLAAAKATGCDFLVRYITATVFFCDVKTALRSAKLHKSAAFVDSALARCDGVDIDELIRAVSAGESETVERLSKLGAFDIADAMEAYKLSATAFEKWVDDRLMAEARKCKTASSGPQPLLGYFLAVEGEIKALHIIASGVRTGSDSESIRERVRKVYG